ncbi:GGDEF domain-containing protein [Sphingomonas morindae]|uniref:diguanylate cyclase n=1 Tax=Sphingomonas morindae TaxID=1541170 RepID=A0ABY4XDW0_9SPHN|nr:GGDEF domain-containing protein [Sphingomonas morindae]USI74951.1 GGDEF domain-containing protein [Sphingomonas morindae]
MLRSLLSMRERTGGRLVDEARALAERALAYCAAQGLAPTPIPYAVAYEAQRLPDGPLARALAAIELTGLPVSAAQAADLHARFIGPAAGTEAEEAARDTLRHQTLRIADIAADAAAATGDFNRDLTAGLKALDASAADPGATVAGIAAMLRRAEQAERDLAAAAREIETLREELDAARSAADQDLLTGLANRRAVERRLATRGAAPLVVALCDVDRFKAINDRMGHAVGDRVLRAVAATLAESCAPHLVARWGGEEFLVLIEGLSLAAAAALVERARARLEERQMRVRETDQPLGTVTFSAGVTEIGPEGFEAAMRDADQRLYAAKIGGRNAVHAGRDATR